MITSIRRSTASSRTLRLASATGVLALGLTACGGSSDSPVQSSVSASPSAATSDALRTATDVAFVANMLPHHKGGIELGKLAETKGMDARVKKLGTAIAAKQTEELAVLQGLAQRLGSSPVMPPEVEARDKRDMAKLQALNGAAFDAAWLEVISGHHSAAIQMADIEQSAGQDTQTTALAADIVTTQRRELGEFNAIIAEKKGS